MNYKGFDHFGAAANYEDHTDMKHDKENAIDLEETSNFHFQKFLKMI